ncbi:LOW QUALITY PROTEIN: ubiquitin carboxyl-terminal hydrolase 26 [Artibeus jamaicensis]|uniref:LOW QUALITY PROTEIN: ubiquitin carboxyl-terminal hydrolase 26 n=1 Tax=Artibeus jamaicensis TaxID=9417 RepID=UPI00235AA381|nr:LOW QUALITY PROTEIN: ubiquitin carboxyl-terminal hydrolase 26 [Artibeus jamaicensis]
MAKDGKSRLSSRDAEELKMFLDESAKKNIQPPTKPGRDKGVFNSTKTQKEINKKLFNEMYEKSRSGVFDIGEESRTPDLQKMPLYTSEISTLTCKELVEKGWGKRKRMVSSNLEVYEKLQEDNKSVREKKFKTNPLKNRRHYEKKKMSLKELKESNKLTLRLLLKTCSTGNPYLYGTCLLQTLSEKIYLALLLEPLYSEDDPEWDRIKMTFDFYPEKLCQGLPNLGNTCYMNAVLQALFSIPPFAYDLLYQSFPWSKIPFDALSTCLSQLLVLKDIYSIKIKKKLLVSIKNAISTVAEIFSDNSQNDAHEFLGHCLDQMKENMEKLNKIWKTKIESEEEDSSQQASADSAVIKMLVCPIITNFEVELLRSVICEACGQVVLKAEVSNYLSINLPQGRKTYPLSIQSTLDVFFGAEELEYKCGKCNHNRSVGVHKFNRLPRVLIVHLKRYSFHRSRSLRKDGQQVIISKYLKLSSHCNESTQPPLPLDKNAHIKDFQFLNFFQKMNSDIFRSLTSSTKLTSKCEDCLALHVESENESEPQKCHIFGSSKEQQQNDLGKYSKHSITEPISANSGYGTAIEQKPLVPGLVRYLEDVNISVICEDKGKPTSGSDTCLAEVHLQKVSRNPNLEKYEKTNVFATVDSVTETTKDFYEDKKSSISKKFSNVAGQIQQHEKMRIYEQPLQEESLHSHQEPDAQWYTKNLRRPPELSLQEANVNSLGASGFNKNLGHKDFLPKKKNAEANKQKRNSKMRDRYAYQLIGVVSHLGNSLHSGHYISDAFDFERQAWFTYNDMQVSSIQEALMLKARLHTGYIFFYMHNDIFKELIEREGSSQPHSKRAGKKHWKK